MIFVYIDKMYYFYIGKIYRSKIYSRRYTAKLFSKAISMRLYILSFYTAI